MQTLNDMNDTNCFLPHLKLLTVVLLVLGIGGLEQHAAQAQVSGVSYSASPVGSRVFWEGNAGLSDAYLYGGELGLGFGEYLRLSGIYLLGNNIETDFSDFALDIEGVDDDALADADLPGRDVDIRRYGGRLRLNLGNDQLIPFVTLGTGVIRFEPDNLDESESIYTTLGAGVTFSVADRYNLSVSGEYLAYRYNPGALLSDDDFAALPFSRGALEQETVYNPSLRAALALHIGGREPGEMTELDRALQQQFGAGGGLQLFVEPFYGQLNFNSALSGFPDNQKIAGINAGIELGPYVGLRGFYWRGTNEDDLLDDPTDFGDIQFYGGELNLRFGSEFGRGFVPYAIVGGGYMDVLSGYEGDPDSRFFATGGGGVELPLGSAIKVFGDARAILMSTEDVEDVSEPSSVYVNPMYTVGIEFNFGGGPDRTPGEIFGARAERERAARERQEEQLRAELRQLRSQLDSLSQATEEQRAMTRQEQQERLERIERLEQRAAELAQMEQQGGLTDEQMQQLAAERQQLEQQRQQLEERQQQMQQERQQQQMQPSQQMQPPPQQGRAPAQGSNLSNQTITVPIPERGEVYLRFGEMQQDGGANVETIYIPPPTPGGVATVPVQPQMMPQQGMPQGQATRFDTTRAQARGLTAEEVRQVVRETLSSQLQQAQTAGRTLSEEDIRTIVNQALDQQLESRDTQSLELAEMRRIADRIESLETRLEARLRQVERGEPTTTVVRTGGDEDEGETITVERETTGRSFMGHELYATMPFIGFRVGEGPEQFLIGIRGDYRTRPDTPVRFMPDATLGIGSSTSIGVLANGVLPFYSQTVEPFEPYAGLGLGLVSRSGLSGLEFAFNILAGAEYPLQNGGSVFVEYNTLDFFGYNRFLFGYRFRF